VIIVNTFLSNDILGITIALKLELLRKGRIWWKVYTCPIYSTWTFQSPVATDQSRDEHPGDEEPCLCLKLILLNSSVTFF